MRPLITSLAVLAVLVPAAGCFSAGEYRCATESECVNTSGTAGFCEPTGFCSFPDLACDSGRRYGSSGGALDGQCTASGTTPDADTTADAVDATPLIDGCVGMPELCNGLDDDCDDAIDDGFALGGACDGPDTDLCQEGVTVCDVPGTGTMCNDTTGDSVEVCNGLDDNCNLLTDEGYNVGTMCDGPDTDVCQEGTRVCNVGGTGTDCTDMTSSTIETCNGMDDDCDTVIDNGFVLGVMCDGADTDLCQEGVLVCNVSGTGTTCNDTTGNNTELCNGLDDNCNLLTDEGYNVGAMCDGADTDACLEGTLVCNLAGTGTDCTDMTTSTVETCNGVDDDCMNGVDDPWPLSGSPCTVGIGACANTGTWMCNGAGTGLQCSVAPGAPGPEFCGDGIDSDCNGGTDPTCPVNDLRAGAINVSAGGTFTSDVTYAHDDTGGTCAMTGGRDVFYQFTLPAAEVVYADTFGSSFDTVIKIENGSCAIATGQQACINNSCALTQTQYAAQLPAGTYCLVVDQFSSAVTGGAVTLAFRRGGRTGTQVPLGASTQTGTTVGGSNLATAGCNLSNAPDVGYWFTVCPETRLVSANTCTSSGTLDSMLSFRAGSGTNGVEMACDDDGCLTLFSRITNASITGPNLFWVIVDGYSTTTGPYTLQLAL